MPTSKMQMAPRIRTQRVPLADQAGLAALGGGAVLLIGLGILAVRHMPAGFGREIGAVLLAVFVAAGAFLLIQAGPRAVVWTIEDVTGQDYDGDGDVGQPGGEERIVFVNKRSVDQAGADDLWQQFIRSRSHSETKWRGRLGEVVYDFWRDILIMAGRAKWNNEQVHQQGWALTDDPESILVDIRHAPVPPTLSGDGS